MVRADIIYLVADSPAVRGAFAGVTKTERMVYCNVRSVGMSEMYAAQSHGLKPEYVFDLLDYAEYEGEKSVKYNGEYYNVLRTYINGEKIEITVTKG